MFLWKTIGETLEQTGSINDIDVLRKKAGENLDEYIKTYILSVEKFIRSYLEDENEEKWGKNPVAYRKIGHGHLITWVNYLHLPLNRWKNAHKNIFFCMYASSFIQREILITYKYFLHICKLYAYEYSSPYEHSFKQHLRILSKCSLFILPCKIWFLYALTEVSKDDIWLISCECLLIGQLAGLTQYWQ